MPYHRYADQGGSFFNTMYTEMVFGVHLFSNEYKDLCYNNSNSTRHARHSSKAWPANAGARQPHKCICEKQPAHQGGSFIYHVLKTPIFEHDNQDVY